MKKVHAFITLILSLQLVIFLAGCGKTVADAAATSNWAIILKDGVAQPFDSISKIVSQVAVPTPDATVSSISEIDLFAYLNHNPQSYCAVIFKFTPSAYVAGDKLYLSTGKVQLYFNDGTTLYENVNSAQYSSGYLKITKNDTTARRLEGSFTKCIVAKYAQTTGPTVTIDGNFGINYPLP